MNIAIIPARGGSKGVPKKNIKLLNGKPLIAYSIEAAMEASLVDKVIVSTDCNEIKEVAESYGATVVIRPKKISGDKASSELALLHVLSNCEDCNLVVFLQCTSPLTTSEDIDATIKKLQDEKADTALAGTYFYHFLWNVDGIGINHNKECRNMRQSLPDQFLESGAVYVMQADGFKKHKHRFFGKTVLHIMPPERVWEIDSFLDFEIAELLMERYGKNNCRNRN